MHRSFAGVGAETAKAELVLQCTKICLLRARSVLMFRLVLQCSKKRATGGKDGQAAFWVSWADRPAVR